MLLKGIVLIVLAFIVFWHPVSTLVLLARHFGISLMINGVLLIIAFFSHGKQDETGRWYLLEGIFDLIFSFFLVTNPAITAAVFPIIVGSWMMIYGIILFLRSFRLRKEGDSYWWVNLLAGILTVFFGFFVTNNLLTDAIGITFWMGLGLLIFGIINIFIAIRLKTKN